MKDLSLYIKENIDIDNIIYKVDSWFQSDENGLSAFNSFCSKCREQHRVDDNELETFYNSFNRSKEFVDYINDNIDDGEVDYKDAFCNIVKSFL